jgi:hypothetical protein
MSGVWAAECGGEEDEREKKKRIKNRKTLTCGPFSRIFSFTVFI